MGARTAIGAMAVMAAAGMNGHAWAGLSTTFHQPAQPYLRLADSPFASHVNDESHAFWVEDFEDRQFNTPGASASYTGAIIGPERPDVDSVDQDDGTVNGSGSNGHSLWVYSGYRPRITITFDSNALGSLPTFAGLVWTDGATNDLFTFEAFDGNGHSIGSFQTSLGDQYYKGQTAEDRFLGVSHGGGIMAIQVTREAGGISGFELDHVQYGMPVPAPGPLAMLAAAIAIGGPRRRRN